MNAQYQGGGGPISPESPGGGEGEAQEVPGRPNCMKKLMLVNEIVYEEKIKVSISFTALLGLLLGWYNTEQ